MTELQGLIDFVAKLNMVCNKPRLPMWRFSVSEIKEIQDLCNAYGELSSKLELKGEPKDFPLKPYQGSNKHVQSLMHQLSLGKGKHIHRVILQGSIATSDEIDYSDFDALVILNEIALSDVDRLKESISSLWNLYEQVTKQDTLQHHGWFVTTKKLLTCHLDSFFPAVIFEHSVILYPSSDINLNLNLIKDASAFRYHLINSVNGIVREISSGQYLKNIYELKSTLSKFMLLPALYMQVKEGQGVYKKDSFGLAKADFSADEWEVMEDVSRIRKSWNQEMADWRKFLITVHPSWSRKVAKRIAPKPSSSLRMELENKSSKMLTFAQLILERAKATNGQV